jgi:hypothetical protein
MKTEPFAELARERFEAEYPPATWAAAANGLEVAKVIHYGQREMKDKWEGFKKGWQAAQPTPEQLAQAAREIVEGYQTGRLGVGGIVEILTSTLGARGRGKG